MLAERTTLSRAMQASVGAQIVLAAYLQLIEWVPLAPWNDLRRGNGQGRLDVAIALLSVLLVWGTARRWRPALVVATLWYTLWLWLQITSWWIPYLTGGSEQWRRVYAAWFGRTYKFLPPIGDHPIPDAAHTVLTILIAAALVTTLLACVGSWRGRGEGGEDGGSHR